MFQNENSEVKQDKGGMVENPVLFCVCLWVGAVWGSHSSFCTPFLVLVTVSFVASRSQGALLFPHVSVYSVIWIWIIWQTDRQKDSLLCLSFSFFSFLPSLPILPSPFLLSWILLSPLPSLSSFPLFLSLFSSFLLPPPPSWIKLNLLLPGEKDFFLGLNANDFRLIYCFELFILFSSFHYYRKLSLLL